jgi:hypothetical protein
VDRKTLRSLRRQDARRLDKFRRALQAQPGIWRTGTGAADHWAARWQRAARQPLFMAARPGGLAGARHDWHAVASSAKDLALGLARLGLSALRWPWRRIGLGSAALVATATALAATQVWIGYHDHPAEFWQLRADQRLGSPIFSRDTQLQGTLFPTAAREGGIDFANYGYVRVDGPLPEIWKASVLALEQQNLFDPWRTVCGVDPLATIKRVATGEGGGSGLAQQNAKNLLEPEEKRSDNRFVAGIQKLREVGAACSLYLSQGGAEGMLRWFATYAPVAQVGGTTRGMWAGAWVIFNTAPEQLEPHQQALLVALAQRPLSLTPASAFAKGCEVLRSAARGELTRDERVAGNQCWAIARARVALRKVMPAGAELDAQIAKLDALEQTGIVPANTFQPLPTRRLVNLSTRTQAALSPAMLARVAEEAEALDLPPGTPLTLTMAQPEQFGFGQTVRAALKQIDESTAGRENLCTPLAFGSPLRRCPGTPAEGARADVVLARMSVASGGISRLYESSRIAFDAQNAIGSVGMMAIALVAAQHGYTADTLVCPRQARDGARLLRRVTRPVHGFKRCGPRQLIPFAEVMARSDNLGAYEVARALPRDALRRGIEALGLTPDPDPDANLAFALAFGTQAATPAQLLALGQALFGAAFGVPARSGGPRVLAGAGQDAPAYRAVMALLPQAAQRQHLRELLQAPVQHPKGTLHHLRGALLAGKTGTTSALIAPQPGARPYVQAKFTLAYAAADRSVVLSIVNAPFGHALSLHSMPGHTLAPAIEAVLR